MNFSMGERAKAAILLKKSGVSTAHSPHFASQPQPRHARACHGVPMMLAGIIQSRKLENLYWITGSALRLSGDDDGRVMPLNGLPWLFHLERLSDSADARI